MKIKSLGHVVIRVSDVARAEGFYNGVLGLPVAARLDQGGMKMTFFSLGNHHDFAVMQRPKGKLPEGGDHLVVGSSRVDLQACKLEYSIVSPK